MNTSFLDSLIDDFGIWQHTDGQTILKEEGYALDDAARGLVACLALGKQAQAETLFSYIQKSRYKDGFYGFATADRKFINYPASDDAVGQAVWAMGYAYSLGLHPDEAKTMINDLRSTITNFPNLRGYAYAVLGTVYVDQQLSEIIINKLRAYFSDVDNDWFWPEAVMTYGNGIIPYAFLRYGLIYKDQTMAKLGQQILQFVQTKCATGRTLGPIGNDGWLPKGDKIAPNYSQQPIDAAYMIWAWVAAYQVSGDSYCLELADQWANWFKGQNIKKEAMYDKDTLKCFDGIDESGVHYHSGAESNICWLLSLDILKTHSCV